MITLDGDGLILEAPKLPRDVVALLKSVKPDLLRVLAAREVAQAVLSTPAPADCPDDRWQEAYARTSIALSPRAGATRQRYSVGRRKSFIAFRPFGAGSISRARRCSSGIGESLR